MSSRTAFHLARGALQRRAAMAAGVGCSAWLATRMPPPKFRMDALATPRSMAPAVREKEASIGGLDPELVKQLSGGSVTGS
jgi:hypothetical protein